MSPHSFPPQLGWSSLLMLQVHPAEFHQAALLWLGSSSQEPVLLAHSALALTCALFPLRKPVSMAISPLALSCSLAALGPQVFDGSYIPCQCNFSFSRHYLSTCIVTFPSAPTSPLDEIAVAALTWSIALLFATNLPRIALEVLLFSETAP